MRKLKLQVQLSVDSYIAGPNGEMDWMIWNWDDKLKKYVFELTDSVETIILGRKMTDGFVSYWSALMNKRDDPFYEFAKKMIQTPKVVFTKTLKKSQCLFITGSKYCLGQIRLLSYLLHQQSPIFLR